MNARIIKVIDEYNAVIDQGENFGVKNGANFLVYGIGEDIFDLEGHNLGSLEIVRGRAKVTHVQDQIATISASERKVSSDRRIIRRQKGIMASIYPSEEIEEAGSETIIPFRDILLGDYAKPI